MIEKWYAKSADAVADMLGTSISAGLSPKAARARLREEGENAVFALPRTASLTYAAYVVSDVSMLLLVLTAILAAVWGHRAGSMLMMFGIPALHCVGAIFTYIKSRRIFESMAETVMPRVRVLRGGRVYAIDARLLVRGDVIFVRPGDVIACDARLCAADRLEVLEYSGRVKGKAQRGRAAKDAARVFDDRGALAVGEQTNMLFAGSVVLAGQGRAIVVETGADTVLVSAEGQMPLLSVRDRMEALEALKRHCGRMSLFMLILILPLTALGLLIPGELNLLDYFLLALSLAVSSMSELTAAIGYIIVGCGVLRAAKGEADGGESGAVLPHLSDLAALAEARVMVLFDDCALTEGKIAAAAAFRGTARVSMDGPEAGEIFEAALTASGLPSGAGMAAADENTDPARTALIEAAAACGVTSETVRAHLRLIDYAAVHAGNPFATALIEEQGAPYAVCCGEAAALLGRCTRTLDASAAGGTAVFRRDRRDALLAACAAETAAGGYAVAYARRSSPYNTLQRLSVLQDDLTLVGVLIFRDPIGGGVPAAVEALAEAGIRTVLMADRPSGGGDIAALARAAGILRRGVICVAPAPISADAELCIGYGAADRRAYLDRLREAENAVIGLGAGLHALPLMQVCAVSAACTPIASGGRRESHLLDSLDPAAGEAYGTELLKKNAGLLVRRPGHTGGGVAGVLTAVRTARQIFANLAAAMRCLLSAQAMRLAAVVLLLALRLPAIEPIQLLFGGLILDFGAILVCAFDRGDGGRFCGRDVFSRPLRAALPELTVGGLCGCGTALAAWLLVRCEVLVGAGQAAGFVFLSMMLCQLVMLFVCRRGALHFSSLISLLWPLLVLTLVVGCLFCPAVGAWFAVEALPTAAMICLLAAPLIALFGGEIARTAERFGAAGDELFDLPEEDDDAEA